MNKIKYRELNIYIKMFLGSKKKQANNWILYTYMYIYVYIYAPNNR